MLVKSIYKIENLINGKIYIGQSIHPYRRLIEHMYMARHHLDELPIHMALSKYKEENFSLFKADSSNESFLDVVERTETDAYRKDLEDEKIELDY